MYKNHEFYAQIICKLRHYRIYTLVLLELLSLTEPCSCLRVYIKLK